MLRRGKDGLSYKRFQKRGITTATNIHYIIPNELANDTGILQGNDSPISFFPNKRPVGRPRKNIKIIKPQHPNRKKCHFYKKFHWQDLNNCEVYLRSIATQFHIQTFEDWYSFSGKNVYKLPGAATFMKKFDNSLNKALKTIYPNYPWEDFKFKRKRKNFWSDPSSKRRFLDFLYQKYNFSSLDDFYQISQKILLQNGGKTVCNYSQQGVFNILKEAYPHHTWDILEGPNFRKHSFFRSKQNIREYILYLIRNFRIERMEDWYRISVMQIGSLKGGYSIRFRGGLFTLLSTYYPKFFQSKLPFKDSNKRANQRILFLILKQLFARQFMIENYRHPQSDFAEFDIFLPGFNLAFEYQGEQHFDEIPGKFGKVDIYFRRDEKKSILAQRIGVLLVCVPYWWDNSPHSLAVFISNHLKFKYSNAICNTQ